MTLRMQRLIRTALNLPITWRWAVKKAEAEPHTRAADCLPCLGKQRREKYKHVPFLAISGSLICKRCSLPVWYWKQQPKCKLKKPPVQGTPIKRPDYIIVPVD